MGILLLANWSLAQDCGPQPEGGCIECGPHWSDWGLGSCPSVSNNPGVAPGSYNRLLGQAPIVPIVTPPQYSTGQKVRTSTYDCNSDSDTEYGNITFTVGSVQWDPPLPASFNCSHVPSFSSTAYVNVTSSDPTLCPDPGRVNIGGCTWNVSSIIQMSGSQWPYTPDWVAWLANAGGSVVNFPVTFSPITGSDENVFLKFCCGNKVAPATVTYDYDTLSIGSQNFSVTIGTASIVSKVNGGIESGCEAVCNALGVSQLKGAASSAAEGFADPLVQNAFGAAATAGNLQASYSENIHKVVGFSDTCTPCTAPATLWFGSEGVSFGTTIGSISVPSNIFQPIGINNFPSISITALAGSLSFSKSGYTIYMGPPTSQFNDTVTTTRQSSIYTDIQIGTYLSSTYPFYWSGPTSDSTTVNTAYCNSPYFP
jgi:hypothetical protein